MLSKGASFGIYTGEVPGEIAKHPDFSMNSAHNCFIGPSLPDK